jgi:hypothetical protein
MHPKLTEGDYGLRFTALYRDEFNTYATSFFNKTVHVLEPHRDLQLQDIFQVALIIAVLGLAAFGAFTFISSGGANKQKKQQKEQAIAAAQAKPSGKISKTVDVESDWLQGTEVAKHQKKKKQN